MGTREIGRKPCSGRGEGLPLEKGNNKCVSDSVIINGSIACMFATCMYLLYSNQNTFIENADFSTTIIIYYCNIHALMKTTINIIVVEMSALSMKMFWLG